MAALVGSPLNASRSVREREYAVAVREQEVAAQVEGLRAAVEAVREGTVTRGAGETSHRSKTPPMRLPCGLCGSPLAPLVMALVDLPAELVTGLQRFRELFRRNKLHLAGQCRSGPWSVWGQDPGNPRPVRAEGGRYPRPGRHHAGAEQDPRSTGVGIRHERAGREMGACGV